MDQLPIDTPKPGQIIDFLRAHPGIQTILLSNWTEAERKAYVKHLDGVADEHFEVRTVRLADPTDYLSVYRYADGVLSEIAGLFHLDQIAVHTSPGTSTMAAVSTPG